MINNEILSIGLSRGASLFVGDGRFQVPRTASRHRLRRAVGHALETVGRGLNSLGAHLARPALPVVGADWRE